MAGNTPKVTQFLSDDELTELISAFPAVEFAFAYGSGVLQQQARGMYFEVGTGTFCVRLWPFRKAFTHSHSSCIANSRCGHCTAVKVVWFYV